MRRPPDERQGFGAFDFGRRGGASGRRLRYAAASSVNQEATMRNNSRLAAACVAVFVLVAGPARPQSPPPDALTAARALGAGRARIIFRHLLPNVAGQLAVATALGVGEAMLLEAGLSFLGAGVRPPTASWGGMIHDGKDVLLTAPWATLAPGLALTAVVLAANRLGDALRDAFDPRTR